MGVFEAKSLLFAGLNASFRTLSMQRLPGFRDYYPEDCAFRNYLFENWRRVARSFGFQEYDGPTLEPTELYKKKSGDELKTQLFRFVDQGGPRRLFEAGNDAHPGSPGRRTRKGFSETD